MKTIQLRSGELVAVDDEDFVHLNKYVWYMHKSGTKRYASTKDKQTKKTIYMHRFVLAAPPGVEVDHVSSDGLDNRKQNLRFVTRGQNNANRRKGLRTTSRFKGVGWSRAAQKWRAYIKICNKYVHLGVFALEEDAAQAYDTAASKAFGEFAHLNLLKR